MCFWQPLYAGGGVIDYPKIKLVLNRLANLFIRTLFRISLNDTTNAFKAYRKQVIDGCRPFISPHFNLTVEIPLKAIVRGYPGYRPDHLAQPPHGNPKTKDQGNGQPISFHLPLRLAGKILQPRRLPASSQVGMCAFTSANSYERILFIVLDQILPLKI